MVSTWDGDELSMIRFHHQSMAVTEENRTARLAAQSTVFDALTALGLTLRGIGSYRLIVAGDAACEFSARCREDGLELKPFANGLVSLVLPYDVSQAQLERGIEILTRHAGLIQPNQ